jgi:N-methylhydantoinase B/oxoprolinase/acetone carboxylase alpha subunit
MNFRQFSMKAADAICPECRNVKNFKQTRKVREVSNSDLEARVIAMEKSLDALHTMISVQVNESVKIQVETIVEEAFDKKLTEMMTRVASSLTSNKKATLAEVDEKIAKHLNNVDIGMNKKRLGEHMKAIKKLRANVTTLMKEIEDIHNQ